MEKNGYIKKAQAKLDELNGNIKLLKAKKDNLEAEVQIEYDKKIEEIELLKKDVENRLDDINSSSNEAWIELKNGFEKSSRIMEETVKSALSKF